MVAQAEAPVVVVDDTKSVCDLIREILRVQRIPSVGYTDPYEALRGMATSSASVLITDFHMPGMDGQTLIQSARHLTRNAHLHCFVVTSDVDAVRNAISDTTIPVLAKPVGIFHLAGMVAGALAASA